MVDIPNSSHKQYEMLKQIDICNKDNEDSLPNAGYKVLSIVNQTYTLNYMDNLNMCVVNKAERIKGEYNLEPFMNPMTEISNNEILLYRYKLEKRLQKGLHALIEIQFLDSLVVISLLILIQ